jgi:hypothetical protein
VLRRHHEPASAAFFFVVAFVFFDVDSEKLDVSVRVVPRVRGTDVRFSPPREEEEEEEEEEETKRALWKNEAHGARRRAFTEGDARWRRTRREKNRVFRDRMVLWHWIRDVFDVDASRRTVGGVGNEKTGGVALADSRWKRRGRGKERRKVANLRECRW